MGWLCDRLHVVAVITISSFGASASVFLLWGFASNLGMLVSFTMCYGFFAGGYSAIWPGMMKTIRKEDGRAKMGSLMGVFAAGRGIGAVVSGPLSDVLLRAGKNGWVTDIEGAYDTEFGVIVVFTGATAFVGLAALGMLRGK